jgi:transmembrane sensor
MSRERLPWPIEPLIAERVEDPSAALQAVRVRRERKAARRRRARIGVAIAAVLIAGGVPGLWSLSTRQHEQSGALQLAGGAALPPTVQPTGAFRALALSDGSWLSVAVGARVDVLESSADVFSLSLREGRARFDVRPGGTRRWRVTCGRITIEVVGTAFVAERDATRVRVSVSRGAVLVRGDDVPDGVQRLNAGQSFELAPAPSATPRVAALAPRDVAADPPSAREKSPDPGWRTAARHGQWSAAWKRLTPSGLTRESVHAPGVDDLLLLADVARLSGHPREAVAPLERIASEHASDPRAALAAFTLATLRLDHLKQPRLAAESMTRALELGLPRALAQDARARLVEAHARAGHRDAARAAAAEYRLRHPRGPRADDVERWSPRD